MKNPPYHVKSQTSEDEIGCTILSQVFLCRQYAIFLKPVEKGRLSVQAETLYSSKLASVTPRLVPSGKLSRREFRNCPTTSDSNYLFVLILESWCTSSVPRA